MLTDHASDGMVRFMRTDHVPSYPTVRPIEAAIREARDKAVDLGFDDEKASAFWWAEYQDLKARQLQGELWDVPF